MDTGIVIFILIAFIAVAGFMFYDHRHPLHPQTHPQQQQYNPNLPPNSRN